MTRVLPAAAVAGREQREADPQNAGQGLVSVPDMSHYGNLVKHREDRDTLDDAAVGVIEGGTWEHRAR